MNQSQGRRLIALIQRREMTCMELLQTGISVSPWKRIAEALRPDERLLKAKNKRGLTVYRVSRG